MPFCTQAMSFGKKKKINDLVGVSNLAFQKHLENLDDKNFPLPNMLKYGN